MFVGDVRWKANDTIADAPALTSMTVANFITYCIYLKKSRMEQSKRIKRSPKTGTTMKRYPLYLDEDLVATVDSQPNKNRFFNAAIRWFIHELKKK
jgi:hypothetical protein